MKRTKASRKEYIPTVLRGKEPGKSRYEVWNVGFLDFQRKYAFVKGSFRTELAALEMCGKTNYLIIHIDPDGKQTPTWCWQKRRWIEITENEKSKFSEKSKGLRRAR